MKAPKFWQKRNFIAYLLWPFSFLYLLLVILRHFFSASEKNKIPVICIGNLTAGGSGKTPVAAKIGEILKKINCDFCYLSRGYSGKISEFTKVNLQIHSAFDVGDEPLLLCEIQDSFIAKNRKLAAKKIATFPNKKLIIMDDGLQNPQIHKDFSILVIDGIYGFGNGFLIPAGPLRENIEYGIKKADLIIIIGEDKFNIAKLCQNKKVIFAKIKTINHQKFQDQKIIAFCGIGRPDKFFTSIKEISKKVIKAIAYADHYFYKDADLQYLLDLAKTNEALLVTTKKDWVRLDKKYQNQIKYLDIDIEFDDLDYIEKQLQKIINN